MPNAGAARALPALVLLVGLLAGCSTAEDVGTDLGALGIGTAVGAATGNPVIGVLAGLGARIGVSEGIEYGEREYYGAIQQTIAEVGGRAPIGQATPWAYEGLVAELGDAGGRVEPVREFGREMTCRELIFSIEDEDEPAEMPVPAPDDDVGRLRRDLGLRDPQPEPRWFVGTICRSDGAWTWAVAAPSTDRWGVLQ
jgi:hypothetical protein